MSFVAPEIPPATVGRSSTTSVMATPRSEVIDEKTPFGVTSTLNTILPSPRIGRSVRQTAVYVPFSRRGMRPRPLIPDEARIVKAPPGVGWRGAATAPPALHPYGRATR